ncbi:MAG: signal peptidase II [Patescibacteria group bacterium]|jgi:signal peptidase II|nr:signal peptidase II [Patescibacteria group bacterium]
MKTKKIFLIIIINLFCLGLLYLDLRLKDFFIQHPDFYRGVFFDILFFKFKSNPYIALGIKINYGAIIFFNFLILIGLIYFLIKKYFKLEYFYILNLSLILIGALSNLIDRLNHHYVVDYISIPWWPVFNLADVMIVAGAILILIQELKIKKQK